MPLYKFVGNKILTTFQNRVLGQDLSEYHSGYRVYSTAALRRIPFEFNSNDFHFDTEIIIQLLAAEQRILELPIPTFYGDEISHVNGLRYAWDVVRSTLGFWLHQRGIFYRYNFDIPGQGEDYELKLGYASSHSRAIERVKSGSMVVDLGCGTGGLARVLETEKGCEVLGVDRLEKVPLAGYRQLDLERDPLPEELGTADVVLLLDVLETLGDPEAFLFRLRRRLRAGHCRLLLTTPNIGFGITRFMLLFGQFNYGKRGILDKKHRRLFTFGSLARLLRQAGFVVEHLEGIPAPFPKALGDGWASRLLLALNRLGIRLSKRFFSYQVLLEATPLATVESLVAETERHSRRLADEAPP
jgi:SAM-dependent methyltransferase